MGASRRGAVWVRKGSGVAVTWKGSPNECRWCGDIHVVSRPLCLARESWNGYRETTLLLCIHQTQAMKPLRTLREKNGVYSIPRLVLFPHHLIHVLPSLPLFIYNQPRLDSKAR